MRNILLWSSRLLGLLVAGFFAMFAFGSSPSTRILHMLPHLLPALLVLAFVAIAWRRPLVGAVGFALCAVGYGLWTRRLDWFLAIGGPLLSVSALYLLSWRQGKATATPASAATPEVTAPNRM